MLMRHIERIRIRVGLSAKLYGERAGWTISIVKRTSVRDEGNVRATVSTQRWGAGTVAIGKVDGAASAAGHKKNGSNISSFRFSLCRSPAADVAALVADRMLRCRGTGGGRPKER